MRVDLANFFNEAAGNLRTWRARYSKEQYPEKVVTNVFYRKVTMEILMHAILNCFGPRKGSTATLSWQTWEEGFAVFNNLYSETAASKTQSLLPVILKERADFTFGSVSFSMFDDLIQKAAAGDASSIEEIEFSYLYHFLTDQTILLWAAFGGTGLSQLDAISKLTGLVLEMKPVENYQQIENVLGKLCVAPFLGEKYTPNFK